MLLWSRFSTYMYSEPKYSVELLSMQISCEPVVRHAYRRVCMKVTQRSIWIHCATLPSLMNRMDNNFCTDLRMYCIDTEAIAFIFTGGSSYSFTIHLDPIFTSTSIQLSYKQWTYLQCTAIWHRAGYSPSQIMKGASIMASWHPRPIYAVHP